MEFDMPKMEFDLPRDVNSIIKVIGVGGGGSNAVNHMYNQGIIGVDFIVCNTDRQALDISPVPFKIQLGPNLTEGRGAGMIPEVGMNAAIENIEEIRVLLSKNTKMVFVTAGMGGGTGTGAAPVIAQVAKDLGILTVGIVTVPFSFEGRKRRQQAEEGLEKMRQNVDTLLIINNERLREFGKNMSLSDAFGHADNILTIAAKGIAEVISVTGAINVDFNDVNTVLRNSGRAIMGSAVAEGDERAIVAVKSALTSPLLNDNDINGARYVLLNITYGNKEVMMDEINKLRKEIRLVSLDPMYVPNTRPHQQLWAPQGDVYENAFVANIGEDISKRIMMLDIENNFKVLLLLGIGMFTDIKNVEYMEIIKKLADEQRLFIIIASTDYIYGTNYQFCHGFIGKDLTRMTQQKTLQAMGRIGRNHIQQDYTIRFRDDTMILRLFEKPEVNLEAKNMCLLFSS
jgi:cell division protein FtsZ